MDFFDRQDHAQRRTRLLIWLFGAAVFTVIAINYLILAMIFEPYRKPLPHSNGWFGFPFSTMEAIGEALLYPRDFIKWLWDPAFAGWVILGTLLSITAGCLYKLRLLAAGGPAVAELLGGRRINPGTADLDEQKLRNVVEEMAIAAGISVPEVYILDNERSINAFAAGHTRDDVAIGVTRGCVKLLSRDELQGVVAHEFSHILNGDTRLNMQLISLAHGIFWPTILGRLLIYGTTEAPDPDASVFDEDRDKKFLPTAVVGAIFVVLGCVSLPVVRLLKSSICRQREWLADATAVQFTRNPPGITGAFKKIGGLFKQGRVDSAYAEIASHLYFVNWSADAWVPFLATHPPLPNRILAIDPRFDGQFPLVKPLPPNQYERDQAYEQIVARTIPTFDDTFVDQIGSVTADRIRQVGAIRLNLPFEFKRALYDPTGAATIIYLMTLNANDPVRAQQLQIIQNSLAPAAFKQIDALSEPVRNLPAGLRLTIAELAVPALRRLEPTDYSGFVETTQRLLEADGAIDLFEYTLLKMIRRQLQSAFEGPQPTQTHYGRVQDVLPQCAVVLSALAHVGAPDEASARAAFARGAEFLDAPGVQAQFLPRKEWDLQEVDTALDRLSRCPPTVQRNILLSCGKTVVADGQVTEREAELLRAVADSLNCPMPPFVEAVRWQEIAKQP